MSRTRRSLLVLLVCAAVALPRGAAAQADWAVAERTDEQIAGLTSKLLPFVDKVEGGSDADGVILYSQRMVRVDGDLHKAVTNRVYLVRDLEGFPARMLSPRVGSRDQVTEASAFVLRGDEIVARPEVTFEDGREEIGIDRLVIDWSVVEKGDVIGWSMVQEREAPFSVIMVRMADVFPSVYLAASVEGGDEFAYEPRWRGMSASDMQIKEPDAKDGRTMTVKINARVRAADPDTPDEAPYPDDYAHAMLVLDEVYVEPENQGFLQPGWLDLGGWNQFAVQRGAGIAALAEETDGLDITLSAITTGKTTAHDKAAAITAWVKDRITRVEGDLISDGAVRESLADVVQVKEGTEAEKLILAAVMMSKAEVPVTMASFRDPTYGEIDESWESGLQFTDTLLRVVDGDDVRYYAPHRADAEVGVVPSTWVGAKALVYDPGAIEEAEAFQEKLQQRAIASGAIDLGRLQREVAAQDWTRWETLPGPQ